MQKKEILSKIYFWTVVSLISVFIVLIATMLLGIFDVKAGLFLETLFAFLLFIGAPLSFLSIFLGAYLLHVIKERAYHKKIRLIFVLNIVYFLILILFISGSIMTYY